MRWSLIRCYGCSSCSNFSTTCFKYIFYLVAICVCVCVSFIFHILSLYLLFITRFFFMVFFLLFLFAVYLRLLRPFCHFANLSSQMLLVVTGIIAYTNYFPRIFILFYRIICSHLPRFFSPVSFHSIALPCNYDSIRLYVCRVRFNYSCIVTLFDHYIRCTNCSTLSIRILISFWFII